MEDETMPISYLKEERLENEPSISISTSQEPVMIDILNKMAIVYNVLKGCIEELNENVHNHMDLLNKLARLTNLPHEMLTPLVHKERMRENVILADSVLETPDIDVLLRSEIVKYYVTQMKIPKAEFLSHIVNKHPFRYQLPEQLKRSGYIWRRLPNTGSAIIMEHPKRQIQKHRYLQKLKSYREESRSLVYIEVRILTRADKAIYPFHSSINQSAEPINFVVVFIAVANKSRGYQNGKIFFSPSIFKCQEIIEAHILKNVIPNLTEPSVIILEDKPYFKTSLPVPTIESEKSEMKKWLEINNIPYEGIIHRSELYELIQKCKTKSDLHEFDALLYSHGHEILRRPTNTDYINYYKPLWDSLAYVNLEYISWKSPEFWQNLEISLIKNESTAAYDDFKMENITDKLLTMAIDTKVSTMTILECDEEGDSLIQEEFILEVKNSFSPEELHKREKEYLSEIKRFDRTKVNLSATAQRHNVL